MKDIGIYVGAGLSVAGVVLQIIPYRWIKRAYIGKDGLGIKFKF
jgi:hypothetical protein